MCPSRPVQWIGEAEARQVMVIARSEARPEQQHQPGCEDRSMWLDWLRRCLGGEPLSGDNAVDRQQPLSLRHFG